jgi:hypothetical protein
MVCFSKFLIFYSNFSSSVANQDAMTSTIDDASVNPAAPNLSLPAPTDKDNLPNLGSTLLPPIQDVGQSSVGNPLSMPAPFETSQLHFPFNSQANLDSSSFYENSLLDVDLSGFGVGNEFSGFGASFGTDVNFSAFDSFMTQEYGLDPILPGDASHSSADLNNLALDLTHAQTNTPSGGASPIVPSELTMNPASLLLSVNSTPMPGITSLVLPSNFDPASVSAPYSATPTSISAGLPVVPSGDHTNQTPIVPSIQIPDKHMQVLENSAISISRSGRAVKLTDKVVALKAAANKENMKPGGRKLAKRGVESDEKDLAAGVKRGRGGSRGSRGGATRPSKRGRA